MSTSTVRIGEASIRTTTARNNYDIARLVGIFLSNIKNENKVIGLDTERSVAHGGKYPESKLAVLELCDGDNFLIVPLPYVHGIGNMLPVSLVNFLNLPDFTFVGVGMNKALQMLESEYGLTCKNAVEIGPMSWDLFSDMTDEKRRIFHHFLSIQKPRSAIFEDWDKGIMLSYNQIELAAANAYFAFNIGKMLIATIH